MSSPTWYDGARLVAWCMLGVEADTNRATLEKHEIPWYQFKTLYSVGAWWEIVHINTAEVRDGK
jgi:hypothetical protein